MPRYALVLGLLAPFMAVGCSTMNNTDRDTLAGGAIGAGAGAAIGAATGHTGLGAAVGGLVGAGTGAIVGNEADKKDRREARATQAAAVQAYSDAQPQRMNEVIDLARSGQSDQVIVNHIRSNRMTFALSSTDLNTLKANGVSDRVIAEMQSGPPAPVVHRRPVYVSDPYYAPPPVVFVRPAPPPPVIAVGIGGPYRRW